MALEFDHREDVKNILGIMTPTIDNGITLANVIILYEGGPENLKPLFYVNNFDAVVTIGRPRTRQSAPDRRIQDMPLRYNADVPVYTCAIDKTGVTATKLLNKIRIDIEQAVEALAQRPGFTLFVDTGESRSQPMGGYDPLWMDHYVFQYRPMETQWKA